MTGGASFDLYRNERAARRSAYAYKDILSVEAANAARREMQRCPRYAPTALLRLADIERQSNLARLWYKDESTRFGLGSFKALGGAYATGLVLAKALSQRLSRAVSIAELARGSLREQSASLTVCCATDGNHGRAVAAGAQVFGCRAVIFLHEGVSEGRQRAIEALGAETVRTPGTYDDSVRTAREVAAAGGWTIVSDTSWPGYETIPADVMQGYGVLAAETLDRLRDLREPPPTHVFVQGGVGGLAAALLAFFWETLGTAAPVFVVVEPERADCLFQSARAGMPAPASGDLDTVMAGLSCGEVSPLAWRILQAGAEFFMTVPDDAAVAAMRLLAKGGASTPPIVAGESATAGLAGLLALRAGNDARVVDERSRVLVIGTEGATDPVRYRELIGGAPHAGTDAS